MNGDSMLFARLAARVVDRLPPTDRGRVLLVTSARRGEGKTYVAAALAAALTAQVDSAVALVDVSPTSRGTSVGELSAASWSDLVASALNDVPQAAKSAGAQPLHIPYGRGDSATMFRSAGVACALNVLRSRFAFVVLDGPNLPDCGVLGARADASLLVINANHTRREIVRGSLRANPIAPEKMMGAVLNETPFYVPKWLYRRAL
jgi:Mrp family chromosome partitioning ATPase